jgi:hypothetical protein
MESEQPIAAAVARLHLANGPTVDEAVIERLAPQLAEVVAGLEMLEALLPLESEPATVERLDERDW